MRKVSILLPLALGLAACSKAVKQPRAAVKAGAFPSGRIEASTIEGEGRRSMPVAVAVLPFVGETNGTAVSDLIAARLAAQSGFKVVERSRLQDIYNELKLGDIGPVDQTTAVKIGNLLGANVLALGSLSTLGQKTVLSARLVKVETGEVVGGVNEEGSSASDLPDMAKRAADQISNSISTAVTTR